MNTGFNKPTPQSDDWQTPLWLFQALDHEFKFSIDGAASNSNTLCKRFNSLSNPVSWRHERVFCNPPYSQIETFVRLARAADIAVLLLPVRTDSDWFRLLVEWRAELRFYRKRIHFLQDGIPMDSPRFATLVAIVK